MKRLFVLIAILLCGCAEFTDSNSTNPFKAEKNSECADFNKVKVFQTLDTFALANVCDSNYSDLCLGMVVRIDKNWNMELWDDKIVTPPEGKCFTYNGTYQYETKAESKKTVPVLSFGYKYGPASEYEAITRAATGIEDFHKTCLYSLEIENVKNKSDKKKFCDCAKQAMTDGIAETFQDVNNVTQEDFKNAYADKIMKKVDVCIKKYPKAMKD